MGCEADPQALAGKRSPPVAQLGVAFERASGRSFDAVVPPAFQSGHDGLGWKRSSEVGERLFADGCDTGPVAYLRAGNGRRSPPPGLETALVRAAYQPGAHGQVRTRGVQQAFVRTAGYQIRIPSARA